MITKYNDFINENAGNFQPYEVEFGATGEYVTITKDIENSVYNFIQDEMDIPMDFLDVAFHKYDFVETVFANLLNPNTNFLSITEEDFEDTFSDVKEYFLDLYDSYQEEEDEE